MKFYGSITALTQKHTAELKCSPKEFFSCFQSIFFFQFNTMAHRAEMKIQSAVV